MSYPAIHVAFAVSPDSGVSSAAATVSTASTVTSTVTSTWKAPAAPSAPVAQVSGSTVNTVSLGWQADSLTDYVRIERATGYAGFVVIATLPGAGTPAFKDAGLKTGQMYRYRLTAINNAGASAASNIVSATPTAQPVATPTGLAVGQGGGKALLSWDKVPVDQAVTIQRSTDGGQHWGDLATLSGNFTTYADSVAPGTFYSYRIKAITYTAASEYSEAVSVLTVPPKVAAIRRESISEESVTLRWSQSAGATQYQIEQSTEGSAFVPVLTVGGGELSTTVGGLSPGTAYTFQIRAVNAGGASDATTLFGQLTIPAAPFDVTLSLETQNYQAGVRINFQGVKGASSYVIERASTGREFARLVTLPAGTTSYFDFQVYPGDTFDYRVKAVNESGSSQFSDVVSIFVPDAPSQLPTPANLALSRTDSAATLTWDSAPAPYFLVQRKLGSRWATIGTLNSSARSFVVPGELLTSTYPLTLRVVASSNGDANSIGLPSPVLAVPLPPATPRQVRVLGLPTDDTVRLGWTSVSGATGYLVERSQDRVNWTTVASGLTGTAYTDGSVSAGTTYTYRVRAGNSAGYSRPTSPLFVTTAPEAPSAASLALVPQSAAVVVSWSDVSGETGYRVQASRDGGRWSNVALAAADRTSVSVKAGSWRYFRVASVGGGGKGVSTGLSGFAVAAESVGRAAVVAAKSEAVAVASTDAGKFSQRLVLLAADGSVLA